MLSLLHKYLAPKDIAWLACLSACNSSKNIQSNCLKFDTNNPCRIFLESLRNSRKLIKTQKDINKTSFILLRSLWYTINSMIVLWIMILSYDGDYVISKMESYYLNINEFNKYNRKNPFFCTRVWKILPKYLNIVYKTRYSTNESFLHVFMYSFQLVICKHWNKFSLSSQLPQSYLHKKLKWSFITLWFTFDCRSVPNVQLN